MTRQLTPHATRETLRKEAKRWLKALRAHDNEAIARLKAALDPAPGDPGLRDVQHALAREYGFAGWTDLKAALEDLAIDRQDRQARIDIVLSHGWGGQPSVARRIVERDPGLSKQGLALACVMGDIAEVDRRLAENPGAANAIAGPLKWTPLLYVAYSRLPGAGAEYATVIARKLLDHGADPNANFDDGWDNPFSVLCGVIGRGEGNQPPHPLVGELTALLFERGAEAFDRQALYNTSIVGDDIGWLRLLYAVTEQRGQAGLWTDKTIEPRLGGNLDMSTVDYLLGNAVGQNHLKRAEWLLTHGADPNVPHAYTQRPVHAQAQMNGFLEMAALLERHGATAVQLDGPAAFQAACLRLDLPAIRAMIAGEPGYVRNPHVLMEAASRDRADLVDLLLGLGADVNGVDGDGISALHRTAQSDALAAARRLVEAGATVDLRERKWRGTPLSWSRVLGSPKVAAFLTPISRDLRAHASGAQLARLDEVLAESPVLANEVLAGEKAAPSPLFCLPDDEDAAVEVAAILLRHGADRTLRNDKGQTAADYAREQRLDDAADLIDGET